MRLGYISVVEHMYSAVGSIDSIKKIHKPMAYDPVGKQRLSSGRNTHLQQGCQEQH